MNIKDVERFLAYFETHTDNPSMRARLVELYGQTQDEYNALLVKETVTPDEVGPRRLFKTERENIAWEKLKELYSKYGNSKY